MSAADRALWTVSQRPLPARRETSSQISRTLVQSSELDPDITAVARNLTTLRNKLVHGHPEASEITMKGALDFIAACEQLTQAIATNAQSRIRHPSQADFVREWMESAQREGLADPADSADEGADPEA